MNPLYSTKTVVLSGTDVDKKRDEILQYFHHTFDIDEQLFKVFADEKAMYMRADPLRHPLIFYFGHTATFFINKLILAKLIDHRIKPKFESMFAIGVDEMSWDDLNMGHYNWPPVNEVREYRNKVRETVDQLIRTLPLQLPVHWDNPFWIIMMGIEHARIHLETSSVLIRQLPLEYLKPIEEWNICGQTGKSPVNSMIAVIGKTIQMGKKTDDPLYGWDNEYGDHSATINNFNASKYLCSNQEFLEFIEAGGYQAQKYWTDEGWNWNRYDQRGHPRFWIKDNANWKLRLVFNEIDMPWNWPVEVNQLEAKAFCNWKEEISGKHIRLPMEEEWQIIYEQSNIPDQPYWQKALGNINMEHFQSPAPVNSFAFGEFYDVIGNVWQWTETPITGFHGFRVHRYYDDFSTPTFDLKHNLIKGGSWISTGNEATQSARYAFRRHFYQHAGFRYVESDQPVIINEQLYETDPEIVRHCHAHYGDENFNIPNYRKSIAEFCIKHMEGRPKKRALDLGCKVGRSSWELAKEFDFVTGIDFTARNIKVAVQLQQNAYLKYEFPDEGNLVSYHEISLKHLGFVGTETKVEFIQADASNLKELHQQFDLILLNDMLDEMYDPVQLLRNIHEQLTQNGILIIASAYDWNIEITKPEKTIGGLRINGEAIHANDDIEGILTLNFHKIDSGFSLPSSLPFHSRKTEYKMLDITTWEKKL